ncbi:glutamate receptor ionotropic, kainate glr-3-like isoform X2 [Eriocheir sinensis]|uniref:glutamate receptor ionotropic, kainate glr-3-like isoform X2 n=1 Tax=Eriocheir sinensis TaxID=95602 RepID=UPI0021C9BFF7|nr:glutamate receptor ionotropic, kainate glr-3-like isoform X2 [Eriocheir sinensis]
MEWFPFIDYKRHTPEGGAVVTPRDSLDYRMLKEISKRLNFTYEMRAPWDNQWGTSTSSGNWTGVVGTLQHQKADFSMMLSYMPTRLSIVHYSGIYASEPLVMVTSKPRPLSQASALIRPFSVEVWVVTLVSAVASGVVLWGLQRVWAWAAGCEGLELSRAMMTTWGILLEDPPIKLPSNMTGQMVVGWWWVYCMLLTIVYRSSLIAHLTVPGQSPTLESLADLLKANRRERWTWGYEPTYGSGWEWLKINENPTVRTVFKSLMVVDLDEQLARVIRGRHAFITWKYYIRSVVAARYKGASPLHTAREELFNYGGYGWGFRRGAPFRSLVDDLQGRLVESGLVTTWLDQLVEAGMTARLPEPATPTMDTQLLLSQQQEGAARVILGLGHLQGIFYLLGFGLALAFATFLAELLPFCRPEDTHKT